MELYKVELFFEAETMEEAIEQSDAMIDNSCGHHWYKPWRRHKCLWQVAGGPINVTAEYEKDDTGISPYEDPSSYAYSFANMNEAP